MRRSRPVNSPRQSLTRARRIVIKIGTTQITTDGAVDSGKITALSNIVAAVRQSAEVILVSSGAVSAGIAVAGLQSKNNLSIPYKQAAAAIGQSSLMQQYSRIFEKHGISIGQVLLSKDVMENRERYVNASNTLNTLLRIKALPIVNENDTMVVDEITVGDNDRLAAMVAQLVEADLLILLSDVDGFYKDFGRESAELLPVISDINDEIWEMAEAEGSKYATGGMVTKLSAALMCRSAGIQTILTSGANAGRIPEILLGAEIGTFFPAGENSLSGRKHWLKHHMPARGRFIVDSGAEQALVNSGSSLLPSGIVAVQGDFRSGDGVAVISISGDEIARGISNYGREDMVRIIGKGSAEIKTIMNGEAPPEAIHRDNLILTIREN